MNTKRRILHPVHPGELLSEHFIASYNKLTPYRVAVEVGLRPPMIYELIAGKRSITAPIALRLGRYFGNSPQFWINLQSRYDLEMAESDLGDRVREEVKPLVA